MAKIHNDGEYRHRMPIFLTPELEQFWVSDYLTDDDLQAVFDYMLRSEALDCHPVSAFAVESRGLMGSQNSSFDHTKTWQ